MFDKIKIILMMKTSISKNRIPRLNDVDDLNVKDINDVNVNNVNDVKCCK